VPGGYDIRESIVRIKVWFKIGNPLERPIQAKAKWLQRVERARHGTPAQI
jgi:hypothetical protein